MWNFDTKVANIAVRLSSVKQSAIALSPDAKCMKRTYPVGNRILTALSLFNFLAELDRLLVDGVLQLYQQHEY
jgi:hypothetical protein